MLLACVVCAAAAQGGGKNSGSTPAPKPCSVIPDPDPCGSTPKPPGDGAPPSPADKFPFPGEPGASPAKAPGLSGAPDMPAAPPLNGAGGANAGSSDPSKRFPFPGEGGAASPSAPEAPAASGSSSSSSSSDGNGGDPSGGPDLKDAGSEGTKSEPGRHILHRVNPPGEKLQSADEREAEDLKVAKFYTQSGNLQGAYLRTQDAVKTAPDDPDAHFALAETAEKLGKKDVAVAECNALLKLDATSKQIKDAHKALEKLGQP